MNQHAFAAFLALAAFLTACAGPFQRAEELAVQEQWGQAVLEYRKALAEHPAGVENRSRLQQAELKAADYYYQRGQRLFEQEKFDAAVVEFQHGLTAMPDHSKLLQAMGSALARREAQAFYEEALRYRDADKMVDARARLMKALEAYPEHKQALTMLADIERDNSAENAEKLALTSRTPISLNFRQTDLRAAFEFIAKAFGVNVVFDESVKSVPVTLFVQRVTFEHALQLMLSTTRTFHRQIGPNSILIAPDTREKRAQYEDQLVRTFYLNNLRAKEMADILKTVFTPKKISIVEPANAVVVRDSESTLKLAELLIENADRRPAEMILDVEILEVNRNKSERLGLDFGQEISVEYPKFSVGSSFRSAARSGTVTLPATMLRFFKQDVDAKTLANPKVRVVNGKTAKIHIGDRVPLRAATIQDATGQTRTTFEYRDIGIKLIAEPLIHLDNSSTVKLGLEVSSLGQNLGTAAEPAFSIGTRNAETSMVLRDGETAILGGLIRDEDRNNRVRIPGLGDVPLLGSLFTSFDDARGRTDVLLTITPRVVRGWELPTKAARTFYSGTDASLADKPLFAQLSAGASVTQDVSAAVGAGPVSSPAPAAVSPDVAAPTSDTPTAAQDTAPVAGALPIIQFAQPAYDASSGQEFEIRVLGSNLSQATSVSFEILANSSLLTFVRGEPGDVAARSVSIDGTSVPGVIRVSLQLAEGAAPPGSSALARVVLRANKAGTAYLVPRAVLIAVSDGTRRSAQVRASRVTIY